LYAVINILFLREKINKTIRVYCLRLRRKVARRSLKRKDWVRIGKSKKQTNNVSVSPSHPLIPFSGLFCSFSEFKNKIKYKKNTCVRELSHNMSSNLNLNPSYYGI